ncbi:hypothetical protein SLEP1_g47403 [Rubroshorea leprosula]|uniref:Uncharacterized protein n=1 Tax=Rubroshorea leprosula TaxID=152421 RepID=A0AAV5LQB6_9ROSI|nr:hypothetical protein SLEP1_g47403 [Rubroshorea leprosula]
MKKGGERKKKKNKGGGGKIRLKIKEPMLCEKEGCQDLHGGELARGDVVGDEWRNGGEERERNMGNKENEWNLEKF